SERFSAPVHESRIHLVSLNRPLSRDARETGNRPLSQQKKGTFGSLLKIPGYPRSWPLLLHLIGREAGDGLGNFYFQFPHDYPRLFGCQDDGANRVALSNDRGDYLGRKLAFAVFFKNGTAFAILVLSRLGHENNFPVFYCLFHRSGDGFLQEFLFGPPRHSNNYIPVGN